MVAYSCKWRGGCRGCHRLRTVETAAHKLEYVWPVMVVKQCVLLQRLRYFLARKASCPNGVRNCDERRAACCSGCNYTQVHSKPQQRVVVCALLWCDAERNGAFAFVHAGRGGGPEPAGDNRGWLLRSEVFQGVSTPAGGSACGLLVLRL